jgi:hypothetical protein
MVGFGRDATGAFLLPAPGAPYRLARESEIAPHPTPPTRVSVQPRDSISGTAAPRRPSEPMGTPASVGFCPPLPALKRNLRWDESFPMRLACRHRIYSSTEVSGAEIGGPVFTEPFLGIPLMPKTPERQHRNGLNFAVKAGMHGADGFEL